MSLIHARRPWNSLPFVWALYLFSQGDKEHILIFWLVNSYSAVILAGSQSAFGKQDGIMTFFFSQPHSKGCHPNLYEIYIYIFFHCCFWLTALKYVGQSKIKLADDAKWSSWAEIFGIRMMLRSSLKWMILRWTQSQLLDFEFFNLRSHIWSLRTATVCTVAPEVHLILPKLQKQAAIRWVTDLLGARRLAYWNMFWPFYIKLPPEWVILHSTQPCCICSCFCITNTGEK